MFEIFWALKWYPFVMVVLPVDLFVLFFFFLYSRLNKSLADLFFSFLCAVSRASFQISAVMEGLGVYEFLTKSKNDDTDVIDLQINLVNSVDKAVFFI